MLPQKPPLRHHKPLTYSVAQIDAIDKDVRNLNLKGKGFPGGLRRTFHL